MQVPSSTSEHEPVIWQKVEWRQGDGVYRFELQRGGLHATLTAPDGRGLTIPMVAWYGLIDALAASRKTRERSLRQAPPRSHARWTAAEIGELLAAYESGATIRALAQAHNRSEQAIEAQLAQKGLWDRVLRQPIARAAGAGRTSTVAVPAEKDPWPPDYWDSAQPSRAPSGAKATAGAPPAAADPTPAGPSPP